MPLQRSRSTGRGSLVGRPALPGRQKFKVYTKAICFTATREIPQPSKEQLRRWHRPEMAPQQLEKIESGPGNGMVSEASNPQHLVRVRAADRAPLRLTSRNMGAQSRRPSAIRRSPEIRKSNRGTRTPPLTVIARSPCDEAIQGTRAVARGLLRCARNDGGVDATIIGHRLSWAPPGLELRQLQKKAPNTLKSLDAKLKSALVLRRRIGSRGTPGSPPGMTKRRLWPGCFGVSPKRYSAATSFRGGVMTTGARAAAFSEAARRSAGTGP